VFFRLQREDGNIIDGFFEWYTVDNQPKGSGTFRGSAGVLWKAIQLFEEYVKEEIQQ